MLEWVGVDATAGTEDWPVQTWVTQRAAGTGDYDGARRAVVADIATVITAMRTDPRWYSDYVERPMGHKRFPLAMVHPDSADATPDQPPAAMDLAAAYDARLAELATLAVALIGARVERGDDLRATVIDVIGTVFGSSPAADLVDRMPEEGDGYDVVHARLADQRTVDRIVAEVLDLLGK
jgi:hypothetical protein